MSSTLTAAITLSGDHYTITGSILEGGTLPREIFIYTNTGTGALGEFYGTCNIQELGRIQIFTPGQPQALFGNNYLRHSEIKILVALHDDPNAVLTALVKNITDLSRAYASQTNTVKSYLIP